MDSQTPLSIGCPFKLITLIFQAAASSFLPILGDPAQSKGYICRAGAQKTTWCVFILGDLCLLYVTHR